MKFDHNAYRRRIGRAVPVKQSFLFFLCFVGLGLGKLRAHSDMIQTFTYGNVVLSVQYGFYEHEERNKALIIAQYAELLCREMDYEKPVILFLSHYYVENISPGYRLFYGKGTFPDKETTGINICCKSKRFCLENILKMLEYAIRHEKSIRKHAEDAVRNSILQEIFSSPLSANIQEVMARKVYRPQSEYYSDLSYYMKDGKYFIFYKYQEQVSRPGEPYEAREAEKVLKELDYIYQYSRIPYHPAVGTRKAMVFDSDSSFYYFDKMNLVCPDFYFISSRQVMRGMGRYFQPFRVLDIGAGKAIVSRERTSIFEDDSRVLVYRSEDDRLVQDLDGLLDGKRDTSYFSEQNPRIYLDTLFQKYPDMVPSGYFNLLRKKYPGIEPALQKDLSRLDSLVRIDPSLVKPWVYANTPCRWDVPEQH